MKKAKKPVKAAGKYKSNQSIVPHIVCRGASDAIAFYAKAFGATELMRLPGPDGKLIHAAVEIHGAMLMLNDEMPQWGNLSPHSLNGTPVTIHLNVADVDAVVAQAVAAGATVKMPVADMFWGDRYGIVEDPFGHQWSIATHMRDMTVAEIQDAMRTAMSSAACPESSFNFDNIPGD